MVSRDYVESLISKLKKSIAREMEENNHDTALGLIAIAANIYYSSNIEYTDIELEKNIAQIAKALDLCGLTPADTEDDTVLFWDGFCLNTRGLAQIYLKALCKHKRVIYVTEAGKPEQILAICDIVRGSGGSTIFLDTVRHNRIYRIGQLNQIICKYKPAHFFFYSVPGDVVATPILYAYEGIFRRYQINLTDHAFWLGTGCCDKCIEFRDYGASISQEYRGIAPDKLVMIPYYPIIDYAQDFLGYPFEHTPEQKIIFSGGALYKTLGDHNRYYHMVEHLLDTYENVIFWYAGNGDDTELKKLMASYPNRVYHTTERTDLFQVMQHVDLYLSTYPLSGGLMYQYAAVAGLVPLTLVRDVASSGVLINASKLGVEYSQAEELYAEADRLLTDDSYAKARKQELLHAVISPEDFDKEVARLVDGEHSDSYPITYSHIDTEQFRQWYLDEHSKADIDNLLVVKNCIAPILRLFPMEFIQGGGRKLMARLKRFRW